MPNPAPRSASCWESAAVLIGARMVGVPNLPSGVEELRIRAEAKLVDIANQGRVRGE
jgi:hypothetical protein